MPLEVKAKSLYATIPPTYNWHMVTTVFLTIGVLALTYPLLLMLNPY